MKKLAILLSVLFVLALCCGCSAQVHNAEGGTSSNVGSSGVTSEGTGDNDVDLDAENASGLDSEIIVDDEFWNQDSTSTPSDSSTPQGTVTSTPAATEGSSQPSTGNGPANSTGTSSDTSSNTSSKVSTGTENTITASGITREPGWSGWK